MLDSAFEDELLLGFLFVSVEEFEFEELFDDAFDVALEDVSEDSDVLDCVFLLLSSWLCDSDSVVSEFEEESGLSVASDIEELPEAEFSSVLAWQPVIMLAIAVKDSKTESIEIKM